MSMVFCKIIDESDLDESPKKKRRTASRSNSSLDKNGRTDRSIGKKLFSTTATGCKIKNENTSTTRSSDDHDDGGNAIADDDICVLCQRAWVTTDDLSIYHDFFRQALKNKNILNSLSDREATNLPASSIDSNPIIDPETLIGKDMMNVMILCDGCDGSYHMICVGLTEVPEDDWFCQYCVETNS